MIATSLRFFFAIGVVFERVSPPPLCTQHNHTEQHLAKNPICIQQLKPIEGAQISKQTRRDKRCFGKSAFPGREKKEKMFLRFFEFLFFYVMTTPFWTQGPDRPSSRAGHRYVWKKSRIIGKNAVQKELSKL